MTLAFMQKEIELIDPVILSTTTGNNSVSYVASLLQWLEDNGARTKNPSWKIESYGNLIEK